MPQSWITGACGLGGGRAMGHVRIGATVYRAAPVVALGVLMVLADLTGQERDAASEFKAAKTSLTQQLRDKKKENRLAAVRKLESFATPEAAKLLLFQGLSSSDEDVRRDAFDALNRLN